MAIKTENSSAFRTIASSIAFLLVLAAALIFLQSGRDGSSATELAALSQAIPAQASRALAGDSAAFDQLDSSVNKVASLRRGGAPGRSSDWQQLVSRAEAILGKRSDIEAVRGAANQAGVDAVAILEGSNELLDRTGSTAIIQEFQQRAARIRDTAALLPADAASVIAADVAFLREVASALAGEQSDLDIRPLDNEGREAALVPIGSNLTSLEEQTAKLSAGLNQVGDLAAMQTELGASAATLLGYAFDSSTGDSLLPGFLYLYWIPIAAVALALLLLGGLLVLHSKASVFERAAKEQAEQNERNQQAILRLLDEMGSLADGDLTVEATVTEDITGTIADSFNFAIEELRKLVATVNNTALMVDTATKQTENTAAHLARATDNQAKEINAATESIVSMAASIEEVSGNAERSSDVARHSVEVAHKGGEAVRRTIDGMNAIRETIQETSKRIKRLGESSQEIGNIVELINDIAEQTNILALNASIQASMAGEAGRGFAVVADEVQRLAERSTNATKQIEVLVRTIQSDTNEAVVSMERSTTDVVGGALLAENAGAALDEIEQVSNQIASLVQNISSSARQQAGSAADVTRRTTRLREIGDQTGQATTATANSISKLSELATQLRKTVEGFTLPAEMMQASALARTTSNAAPPPAAPPKPRAKTG
ncbi:MAG: methyl-accepting chemotaxis protein [Gammaproteobacteria bacterium]|nr:methyl-accepting chemotaxis protein [Gammaproteobacteria bacterium]NNL45468.1 methyl-accepting chemotaxis protein [Woeseiaceae bacterium]